MKIKFTFLLLFLTYFVQGQFTPGRIVVSQVGDGTTSLSGNTAPVSLLEFDLSTANQTIPTPKVSLGTTTAGSRLTTGGATAQSGQLSLSADGKYLLLVGYDHPVGIATPASTTVNKVIGRIDVSGAVDYSTNFPSANGTTRSVVSDNGTRFWSSIDNVGYTTFGQTTTPTQIATGVPRTLNIFNGQLYYHTGFGSIIKTNTALPTASSTTTTAIPISPALSSNGFVLFDTDPNISWDNTGYDLLYLTNSSSGLEKYFYNQATLSWLPVNSQYHLTVAITNGGSGYTSAPTVKIGTDWQPNTAYTVGQQVLGTSGAGLGRLYTVTVAGTSGTTSPVHTSSTAVNGTVTFTHAAASPNAAATAIISGGVVTGLTITTQQNGYSAGATPAVTFSGGGGSGATATAAIPSNAFNPSSLGPFAQITGKLIGGVPTLFLTSGGGTATTNRLVKIVDNTSRTSTMTAIGSPATTLATAMANYAFRGVAFATENPEIVVTPATLNGFSADEGTASATQSYTVRGSYLGADIAISAPTGYEISKTSSTTGFATTQTLTPNSSTVPLTSIFARIANTAAAGTANGNIANTSTGATSQNVAVSGTVNASTSITITGSTTAFSTNQGTPSATQNYTVSGSGLTADIALTAPTGFEISTSASSGFAGSLTLAQSAGSVSATTIYVRLTGANVGSPSGNITHTSTGATAQNAAVSGTVAGNPTITVTGTPLNAFNTTVGTPSATQTYSVSGTFLTNDVSITAPTDFEISLSNNSGFAGSLNLIQSGGSVSATTIYVRLTGANVGSPSGNITHTSTGATAQNVAVSGTVIANPSISITSTLLSTFSTIQNTPSATQNYSVSGANLTTDIAINAPTGFEISLSGSSGFAGSLTLPQSSGSVASTPIFVRLTGASAGSQSGNITHTSTGATQKDVAATGTVNAPATGFSKNNITVLRVGDGTTALGATATNVDLLEITPTGTPTGFNIALPSTGTTRLVLGGANATYEGQLNLSADNRYLVLAGYNTALGNPQTGTPSMTTSEKVIARIGFDNAVDLTTRIPVSGTGSGFGTATLRNVATENGSTFFVAGSVSARQINFGTTNSSAVSGGNSWRSVHRFGGVTYGINFQVPQFANLAATPPAATDLPSAAAVNALPNFTGGGSATGMILLDADPAVSYNSTGYDLLYITEIGNGIRKWYWDVATNVWVPAGIVNPTSTTGVTGGFFDLTVKIVAGKPEIYAVKGAASNNNIMKLVDNTTRTGNWQTGTAPTVTTLASAGANYMFRGVAFSPVPLPLVTLTPSSLNSFQTYRNTPSVTQTYTVNGINLLNDIVINAPAGYEISLSASSGFTNTLTLPQVDGSVTTTTIFARLTGATVGTFNGNITHTTNNSVVRNVAVTGVVDEIPSIVITGTPLNNFSTVDGTPSATQNYSVSGADLIANVTITAPTGYEISLSANSGFAGSLTLSPTAKVVAATTIFARLIGNGVGTPSGNITHTSSLAPTQNVAVTGNIIANNGILVIETPITAFTTTQATPSVAKTYKVGGRSVTADIVITAPAEFEVSLSASSGFTNTITLPQSGGSVPLTTIYVRLTGATVLTISSNITHTSTGSVSKFAAVEGTILVRPIITISSTSLSGFVTSEGTPSATQNFTVSGSDLIANLALTAPTGFEISTSASTGFANALSLTPTAGAVASTIIYVRLTGATISSPNGNIDLTTTGAVTKQVAVSGIVNPKPLITVAGTLIPFSTREQTASATQTYTVEGINLVADVVLTAPTGFEISTSASSGFANTLTLTQSGGNLANTTIYVRIASTATAGTLTGNITNASLDAITKNLAVTGSVSPFREIMLAGTPLTAFTTFVGTPSTAQNFTVSGINLTNDISINAPTGYEISLASGSGYGASLTLAQSGGNVASTIIYARLSGISIGTPSGNIALTSAGTDPKNVTVSGTVNAIPVITTTGTLTAFSTTLGVLGATQSFTVNATNLLENIVVTAPTGFVVSLSSDGGFANSVSLVPVNGAVTARTIYVRINEAIIGTPSGNITLTTNGATTQNVAVSGTVASGGVATVYYVSPTGDDNNNGTSPNTPFRNLSKFSFNSSPLTPGTVVYLMNGTHGAADLAVGNTGNALVEITKSGTLAQPIKFTNYPGHTPLVQFNGWNGVLIKASHIIIDGLKVRGANSVLTLAGALNQGRSCNNPNSPFESKYNGNGINIDGRLSVSAVNPVNVTVKNCVVYECGGGGIATLEADYLTIENNITYDNAWYSVFANSGISVFHAFNSDNNTTDYKTIIRNNISYGNEQRVPWPSASCTFTDGNGIIIDDFRNTQSSSTIRGQVYTGKTLVANNLVYNNGGRGVHAYIADNCTFINNTSYNNNATPSINDGEITIIQSNNARVFNNVMVARTGKRLSSYSGSFGLQEGNNLMYNSSSIAYFNNTDIMAEPQFVNAAAGDFRLAPNSPGIDAGNGNPGLFDPKDILDVARPFNGRVDIGAYEFTGTVPTANKFTEGNLVALRVGDGSTTIGTNTHNVDIIEYNAAGTPSGLNIPLPSTGTNSFVLGGTTTIPEGQLTLSGDGRYLSAVGYNTTLGQSNSSTSDKIIVRIDDKSNLDLSTKIPVANAFGGSFIRNAVTENGSSFFVTANATARLVNLGANTSATFAGASGYFSMMRLGGLSYYLNFQVPGFISTAGTATPLPSGGTASANALPNFTGGSEGTVFTMLDSDPAVSYNSTGFDVLYIAEKSSGIRKWYWDASTNLWVVAGINNPAGMPAVAGGFYSVVSRMESGKPTLYAVKGATSGNTVMKIMDNTARTDNWQTATGATAPTISTIIPAGSNYMFRGLTFAPVNKPENQLLASVEGNSMLICSGSDAVFTITGTSGATVTYNINGGTNATTVLTGGTATVTVAGATANQTLNLVSITNGTLTQALTGSYLITTTAPTVAGTVSTPSPVCAGTNSTTLTLSGSTGAIIGWERSLDNFATAGTYINFLSAAYTVTNLTATTSFRAIIQNGTCARLTSSISTVTVNTPTITGTLSTTVGSTTTLTGSGTPASTNPWVSASPNVATVDNAGVVTGVAVGTSVITYTNSDGCTATATVTITAQPLITITGSTTAFSTTVGTSSATQTYSVSGANLTANIALNAPTGYEISLSASTSFAGSLTLTQASGNVVSTPIYVRLTGTSIGTPSGNITHASTDAVTQNVAVSGTVNALPLITITGSTTAFSTTVGTPSATQTYSVSGANLTANIALNAPTGYEISLSASTSFAGSLTLTQASGNVVSTPIYVRLTGTSIGTPSGNITHASTDAVTQNVAVSGTVTDGTPCQSVVNLVSTTDDYASGTQVKQAASSNGKINATNKITGNAKTTYQAKSIELKPGFKADSGTVFKAEVGGCN